MSAPQHLQQSLCYRRIDSILSYISIKVLNSGTLMDELQQKLSTTLRINKNLFYVYMIHLFVENNSKKN